ncbi:MAG: helix-turn-helix domain-containing protein [Pirellulales bacterium]
MSHLEPRNLFAIDAPACEVPKEFLSPAEFATRSGLSESTVRRRVRDGTLPHRQPGLDARASQTSVDGVRDGTLPHRQPGGKRSRIVIPHDALVGPHRATGATRPTADQINSHGQQKPRSLSGPKPLWQREHC